MDENEHLEPNLAENYRKEYDAVVSSWKFFVGLRFIVVGFAVTLQSALITLYSAEQLDSAIIPIVGIFIISAIWLIEQRTIELFRLMNQRGVELEFLLGLPDGQFHRLNNIELVRPPGIKRIVTHTIGISIIYATIYTLWFSLITLSLSE